MGLWIRSQKKWKLIQINSVEMVECNKKFLIVTNFKKFINGNTNWVTLGEYKTEKRALEVLDDIQKFIYIRDNKEFFKKNYYTNIYNMPKE